MDPPEHTRLRRLAAKAFTVRRIEMLRPRAQEIVDGLLDTMIVAGPPADLAEALSWPLPITIVCDLLGVPFADRDRFRAWTDGILVLSGPPEAPARAIAHLEDYILGLIVQRRAAEPVDDLLGDLIAARNEEDRLSEQELVTFASDLLFAGHETTANQIGNFVYTLLTNPSRWQELLADPDLVPAAVEELSRITPLGASSGSTHIATEDLELGGRSIKAGDALIVEVAAAHRDPGLLDHPNEIDFHRGDFSHLAYGHGAHRCIGAQLARVELQVAIATLVRRLPSLRLAVPPEQICWRQNHLFRGVVSLPVTWQVNG